MKCLRVENRELFWGSNENSTLVFLFESLKIFIYHTFKFLDIILEIEYGKRFSARSRFIPSRLVMHELN
jgi:hypothetical protein